MNHRYRSACQSRRFNVVLDADMTVRAAMSRVLLALLDAIEFTKTGVVNELDSECLHDFRVAIRRTRAALSLLENDHGENQVSWYKNEFASLARSCNRLRDYDVFIGKQTAYQQQCPPAFAAGQDGVWAKLVHRRNLESGTVLKMLQDPEVDAFLQHWRSLLERDGNFVRGEQAEAPMVSVAKEQLIKRYSKVLRSGRRLTASSSEAQFHALRLQCKKLRYLLEFFSSLFPSKKVKKLVGALKKLQHHLGEYNDLAIQQKILFDCLGAIDVAQQNGKEQAAAIGALVVMMTQRQYRLKKQFQRRFEAFTSSYHPKLFKKLSR